MSGSRTIQPERIALIEPLPRCCRSSCADLHAMRRPRAATNPLNRRSRLRHRSEEEEYVNVDATNTEVATHLDRIGQVAISVSDLARSKDFYQNKLGMKFLFDAGSMAFFQCGDIRILIGASDKPIETSSTILYFKVGDIHAVHTHLAGKGVTFTDPPHLVAKM